MEAVEDRCRVALVMFLIPRVSGLGNALIAVPDDDDDDDDACSMLPEALLCLLSATLAFAQTRTTLSVNAVVPFTSSSLPKTFALSPSPNLALSVAICSDSTPIPRFFVSNISNSDSQDSPSSSGGTDVFEISVQNGQGNWTGIFPNGGLLAVEQNGAQGVSFQVGVSDNRKPSHYISYSTY